jgi:hypothetical protein
VAFPGTPTAEQGGQNISIATAVQAQVPSQQEAPILKADGVTSIGFLITKDEQDPQLIRGLWSFTPSAGTSLPTLLEKIDQEFANAGYQQMPGLPAGVVGLTVPPGPQQTGGVYRAHYITQGVIVRVEAYGPDADAAKQAFDDLLQKELDKFPPTS